MPTDPGIPSYVNDGYVKRGYQKYYATGTTATPGDPSYVPPGTPAPVGVPVVAGGGTSVGGTPPVGGGGTIGGPPPIPPNWPTLPPSVPPETCPPLNSPWAAGPTPPAEEIGYTPPASNPNDDGLNFPASPSDLMLRNQWHGIPSTMNPGNIAIFNLQLQQIVRDAIGSARHDEDVELPASAPGAPQALTITEIEDIETQIQIKVIQDMMQGTGLWYELVLKPLTNGPFSSYYVVSTVPLSIPQTIDLSAPSA